LFPQPAAFAADVPITIVFRRKRAAKGSAGARSAFGQRGVSRASATTEEPIMSRIPLKPFLIVTDAEGQVRLTVRETRYNSQGYPLVTSTLIEERFKTATAARAHAKEHLGAQPGEFAAK
jgi:hypothetical protein